MSKPDIVLCAPVRTPIGGYGGALKETAAPDLGAAVVRETLRRSGHDTTRAHTLQGAFKLVQAQFIASRDRLREDLEQIATR